MSCSDERRKQRLESEIEAVEWALGTLRRISETRGSPATRDIARNAVQLAEMVYIKRTHGVVGASIALHFSERTAKRYHQMFLRLLAARLGMLATK